MKVVVNDIAATPDAGGVYSVLSDLYDQVSKFDHTNEWIFILSGKYFPNTQNITIVSRPDLKKYKVKKLFFEVFNGHKFINSYNPDVYISLQNIATIGVNAPKQIVYLHQPIPFQSEKRFSFLKKAERRLAFYQYIVGFVIKKTISKVKPFTIVQTEWMRKALLRDAKISSNKVTISHPFVFDNNDGRLYKKQSCNFFYPASGYLYKNHGLILRAVNILNKKGIKKFRVKLTLNQENKQGGNFEYLGHISREKVLKMYENNVLLFPSYIESFGLPLIEAAIKADIILAADTEFAREILEGYNNVYFYRYNDAEKLATLMERVMNGDINTDGVPLSEKNNSEVLLDSINRIIGKF